MPKGIYNHKKLNRWSKKYDHCIECGTTNIPYAGNGLCRKCYAKKHLQENKESIKAYQQYYRQKNKENIKIHQHEYSISERGKEVSRKSALKYYRLGHHRHRTWSVGTLNHHRKKGYIINISIDELVKMAKNATNCPLCGSKLKWKSGKFSDNSPTLDRINNGNIIDKDSIWIICRLCNSSKQNRSLIQFHDYCKNVIKIIDQIV